jgi:flagellar motor switch protein FliN/FliY
MTAEAAAATGRPAREMPDHVLRIRVDVDVVLGTLRMPLADVVTLGQGAVIALDRKLGDLVDIAVNGRVVARGEVVALEDEPDRLGVVIRQLLRPGEPAPAR